MPQSQILQEIKTAIYSNNLERARELIFNSTGEKPNTATISEVLKLAADREIWDIVQQICQIEGENSPSQVAIEYVLAKIVVHATTKKKESKYLEFLQFICEKSPNKPSQKSINDTLSYAYTFNSLSWDFVKYLCALKDNKPTRPYIDEALKKAADREEWDVAQQICQMESENRPSQDVIDYVLAEIVVHATTKKKESKYLDFLQFICEKSPNKPSQKSINVTLNYAHTFNSLSWEFVKYLCALKDNKPTRPYIDEALKKAADREEWDVAQQICQMESENRPSQDVIDYVLAKIVVHATTKKKESKYLEFLQFICEKSPNKPSQKSINDTLSYAYTFNSLSWDFVKYLCALRDNNKPTQLYIDGALKKAAEREEWDIVRQICRMEGENSPSQAVIDDVLAKIVAYATNKKEGSNYLDLLQFICEKTSNKPSQKSINDTLRHAYTYGSRRWDFVKYLCALQDNKPTQPFIDGALEKAASCGNLEIVQYLCQLPKDRCPQADGVGSAFICAVQGNNINIIRFFWEEHTIKPPQKDIAKAFVKAPSSGNLEIVNYFLNPKHAVQIDQQDIDDALLTAVTARNGFSIIQLLLRHLPRKEAIAQALHEAEVQKKPEIWDSLAEYSQKAGYSVKVRPIFPRQQVLGSNFSSEQLQAINRLIDKLQKEVNSCWPFPNRDRKEVKINGLTELKELAIRMPINTAIEQVDLKYKGILREGIISTRVADLLDSLRTCPALTNVY